MAASNRITIDDSLEDVYELFYERGWTDGLPVVPPTPSRVETMLASVSRNPAEVVASVAPMRGNATVEKIAINAVMAGCLPEYLPVVIAAVEAMAEPRFDLYGIQATTNPVATMAIINGPIRKELDINCGHGCLGPGWRSNATIGRAIRLVLLNIGGGIPGVVDRATWGQPAKYTCCFGENEEASPWEPLHVERGFSRDQSTVTMVGVSGMVNISEFYSKTPQAILRMLANSMTSVGSQQCSTWGGEPWLLLGVERVAVLGKVFSKADVKRELYERALQPVANFCEEVMHHHTGAGRIENGLVRLVEKPEDIMIVVGGGAGPQSVFLPTFITRGVTKPISMNQ